MKVGDRAEVINGEHKKKVGIVNEIAQMKWAGAVNPELHYRVVFDDGYPAWFRRNDLYLIEIGKGPTAPPSGLPVEKFAENAKSTVSLPEPTAPTSSDLADAFPRNKEECDLLVKALPSEKIQHKKAKEGMSTEIKRHPNSARFHELLGELAALHDKKQADYGKGDDPFANVRASIEWGVQPWVGALIRLNDKVKRLQSFAIKGELANESAEDSMRDIAVYSIIALVLYEQQGKTK